jgi:hypothetical protein
VATINVMMAALLESLMAEMRAAGTAESMCMSTIYPGADIPLDFGPESGCGGTAWLRLVSANPTANFPTAASSINNCHYSLAYTVEMGIARPAPVMEDHLGNFTVPDDVEQFDAANALMDDMALMHRAIRGAGLDQLILGDWTPQGPAGGVMGGTWTLVVGDDEDA